MATGLQLINRSLLKAGISQTVVATHELTRENAVAQEFYHPAYAETLRAVPWGFAAKRVALTLRAGSSGSPINRDFIYGYAYPVDCLMARRLLPERPGGRTLTRAPVPFEVGRSDTGADEVWIYTDA